MQRAAVQRDANEGKPGGMQPPRVFVQRVRRRRQAARIPDQPFGNGVDVVVRRPLSRRALDHAGSNDVLAFDQGSGTEGGIVAHGLSIGCYSDTVTLAWRVLS